MPATSAFLNLPCRSYEQAARDLDIRQSDAPLGGTDREERVDVLRHYAGKLRNLMEEMQRDSGKQQLGKPDMAFPISLLDDVVKDLEGLAQEIEEQD